MSRKLLAPLLVALYLVVTPIHVGTGIDVYALNDVLSSAPKLLDVPAPGPAYASPVPADQVPRDTPIRLYEQHTDSAEVRRPDADKTTEVVGPGPLSPNGYTTWAVRRNGC